MEQRLSLVTLGVEEMTRAREFYEKGLGWRPTIVMDDVVFYQVGGMVISLYPYALLAKDARLDPLRGGFGGITLAHNVRSRGEVDAIMGCAAVAGAMILKPAEEAFWGGYSGYFADPDGHPWEVAWNPAWELANDGGLVLPT